MYSYKHVKLINTDERINILKFIIRLKFEQKHHK